MKRNSSSRAKTIMGRFVGSILPREEAFREEYDMSHISEYTGPCYDDPQQLAEVRRILGLPAVEQSVEVQPRPIE